MTPIYTAVWRHVSGVGDIHADDAGLNRSCLATPFGVRANWLDRRHTTLHSLRVTPDTAH
jgi:hypothetical protein